MVKKNKLEKKNWYFITLTVKHTGAVKLEDVMTKLLKAREKISRNFRNSKRQEAKTKSFFSKFDGLISSIEIKPSEYGNGRHPHLHIACCTDEEIPIDIGKYKMR
jgi:hypothetical protein